MKIEGPTLLWVACLLVLWSHPASSQDDPVDFIDACAVALDQGGCEYWEYATLYTYTGDQRTLAWVPHPSDDYRASRMLYFVEIRSLPADILVTALQTAVAETQVTWTPARAGHYLFRAMACDPDLIPSGEIVDMIPSEHCSEWALTTNDFDTPAGLPGFVIYAAIPPPTGGGIE